MAVRSPVRLPALPLAQYSPTAEPRRRGRWRFFQVVFFLTYLGIVLDIVTTAMGFGRMGNAYEQNPLGGQLIGNLGWVGLLLLMTALCVVCYVSFRVVFARMSLKWSAILNSITVIVLLMRWVTVAAAVAYLIQPG